MVANKVESKTYGWNKTIWVPNNKELIKNLDGPQEVWIHRDGSHTCYVGNLETWHTKDVYHGGTSYWMKFVLRRRSRIMYPSPSTTC